MTLNEELQVRMHVCMLIEDICNVQHITHQEIQLCTNNQPQSVNEKELDYFERAAMVPFFYFKMIPK